MFTITRANHSKGRAGETLPAVFPSLEAAHVAFRRGQVTLIAAAPGVGKSVLAMTLALDSGVPALYFSADTDQFTMNIRCAAHISGHRQEDVEQSYDTGHASYYTRLLEGRSLLRFNFTPGPDFDEISEDIQAFAYTYGQWPELIIMDNLSNVYTGNDDQFGALEDTLAFFKEIGRLSGAAIVVLHHLTGQYDEGNTPVPLSGLRGKISKTPEMILTLFRAGPGVLGVCSVKNRTGRASADGSFWLPLTVDMERMTLHG